MWATTSSSVALGAGLAAMKASMPALTAAGSPGFRADSRDISAERAAPEARTASLMKPGTNVTMTMPPLAGIWRSTASGTLRGWAVTARADECEKITGAVETRMASVMVSSETWLRSTIMPMRFISLTTCSPNGDRPPHLGASVALSAQVVVLEWVSVM
ncbi:hypothetical protein D3C85_1192740 [compost metagenome]